MDISEQKHCKQNKSKRTLQNAQQTEEMKTINEQLRDRDDKERRCKIHITGVPERGEEGRS